MATFGVPAITTLNGLGGANVNGVIPDIPDIPNSANGVDSSKQVGPGSGIVDFTGMVSAMQNTAPALEKAQAADSAFVHGKGNLMEMMLQRKIADTYLQIDEAFSSKAVQAITTLMNMQV
jgi:flagellar hook-basal body complex protein FliE